MNTIIKCAVVALATLAAAPAMAQSQGEGRGGGGGGVGGGGGEGGGSRWDRASVNCVTHVCSPRRERPRIRIYQRDNLCGQQLSFGRDAIYYYERCDRFM